MDARDRAAASRPWYTSLDQRAMTVQIELDESEEVTVPVVFEVCPLCEGKGKHVNPSIDAHGISREEFDEDPDFAEGYFAGHYDVPCYQCKGERVVPVPDPDRCAQDILTRLEEREADRRQYLEEVEAERRWGC